MTYSLPSRPSDSGPDHKPTVDCPECGAAHQELIRQNTYACQGAIPDDCTVRMCEECLVRCGCCDLPVCEQHRIRVPFDHLPWCHTCVAGMEADLTKGAA